MIKFENVGFQFDSKIIVQDFSLEINEGEHVCLMGESGSGKTTIMNSLMGLCIPSEGNITVRGLNMTSENIHLIRSILSWVPQEVNLPYETVKESIYAPFQLKVNHSRNFDIEKMYEYFDALSLTKDIYEKRMNEISGGERQRLMLTIALMLQKPLLLLDEPTSAIDPHTRDRICSLIHQQKSTVLAVSHDPVFAQSCDRIINITKMR